MDNEENVQPAEGLRLDAASEDARFEWKAPTLIREDIEKMTKGGILTNVHADGHAYT